MASQEEKARLTEGEQAWLRHMQRWGSDGYPVVKRGRRWWVDDAFGAGGCPSPFKTKREAIVFCDRYLDILLGKLGHEDLGHGFNSDGTGRTELSGLFDQLFNNGKRR